MAKHTNRKPFPPVFMAWATSTDPYFSLCLWNTRQQAEANAATDERVFRVKAQIMREVPKRPIQYEGNPF